MLKRESWKTRLGFIFAAVGSAVGLGNVWRFPFRVGEAGGAAFVAIYLAFVFLIGFPAILVEFVIGRRANRNPIGAFKEIGHEKWKFAGVLSIATVFIVLAYYSVVGGWVLRYAGSSLTGGYFTNVAGYFEVISEGAGAVLFHFIFMAVVAGIIALGIRKGIEKSVKFMVPSIVVLLVVLGIYAFFLEGSGLGYAYYLSPDLGYLAQNWTSILSEAAGQAFFTLSLGMGVMLTYSSYLDEDKNLAEDAASITGLDSIIAIMAGLVVFPMIFTIGLEPMEAGAGALFVGVGEAVASIPGGRVIGFLLFFTVFIAAVSSAISILEVVVSYVVDTYDIERKFASVGVAALIFLAGVPVALQADLLAVYDDFVYQILLPLGMFLFVLFVGWFYDGAKEELRKGMESERLVNVWLWYVRVPILVVTGFVVVINVLEHLGITVL
ncbi:MAG: sodium-dependent transporter [Candidatus Aenigmatarchaeota archaeon]